MPDGLSGAVGAAPPPVVGWVLAAGQGRRMGGQAKAALSFDGISILESLVHALRDGGCAQVNVLVGTHADVLRPLAERSGAQVTAVSHALGELPDTQRDAARLHARLHPACDMLLCVADLPLLRALHVQALLRAWRQAPAGPGAMVMAPVVGGQRGHPVLLRALEASAAAATSLPQGLRGWLQSHPQRLTLWPSSELAYVTDVDDPEGVERIRQMLRAQTSTG
jgi:molybdenum cofactor cytidylyltransferase